MKNVTALLRDSMKVKPASKRGARQKTSTPKGVTRLNYNENNYGPAPEVTKLLIDSIGRVNEYQDFLKLCFVLSPFTHHDPGVHICGCITCNIYNV